MNLKRVLRNFGAKVRYHRQAQGWTLPDFATIAHLGKGHLSKIENGECNVSLETVHLLARALKLQPQDLVH